MVPTALLNTEGKVIRSWKFTFSTFLFFATPEGSLEEDGRFLTVD